MHKTIRYARDNDGLHIGECEVMGPKVGGIAVHIAARIMAMSQPGGVMVSRTVKDLVAGSGLDFEPAGRHALRGVTEEWELHFALSRGSAVAAAGRAGAGYFSPSSRPPAARS